MYLDILKSFLVLIPLALIGISTVKRVSNDQRAEVVIPLGIITGLVTFIFFLNLMSYLFKGWWGILLIFILFIALSIFLLSKFKPFILDYPQGLSKKFWQASLVFWGLFLYIPIAFNRLGAESFMYYGIGKTFAHGNFPILAPWQPDLYVAYHYGASILLGAINALTGVHLDQLHRLIPFLLILCSIQLLIHGLKRLELVHQYFFYQIIPVVGLVCFGSLMIVWPILPVHLPELAWTEPFNWLRALPTIADTMDSYGLPSRLEMIVYQLHHAIGIASFLAIFFLSLTGKLQLWLFWVVLIASLGGLALTNESVFPSALFSSFLILFFRINPNWRILKCPNLVLIGFFLLVILISLVQGGIITDSLFRNIHLESGLSLMTVDQIPEKISYLRTRTYQLLPNQDNWLPLRWLHLDFIAMYLTAITLILLNKLIIKNHQQTIVLLSLILAALVPNSLYYLITVKFLPSDGNRFLTFTYIFLGVTIALGVVHLLEKLYSKNKLLSILPILIVLWILIPTNLPYIANFWKLQHQRDFFFELEYEEIPPVNLWLENNVPISERVLDLANYVNFTTEGTRNFDGRPRDLSPYSGVLTPYWDGKYQAYMYTPGPDYLDILYTLNPSSLNKLRVKYLVIDKQFFQTLPKLRQEQLGQNEYFSQTFTDDQTTKGHWTSVFRVEEQYLAEASDIDQNVEQLDKLIPEKAVVFLDPEYEPYSWLQIRNAIFLYFSNRELVFNPQGMGGYGFLGFQFRHRFPQEGDQYQYLILKGGTDPKLYCDCQLEKIWEGYLGKATAYRVLE